ncbi:MAG: hypothetical protein M3Y81_15965 [Chloroflexota bacterium]|nr:hypothetical protein [Chloroflexota bacterium]
MSDTIYDNQGLVTTTPRGLEIANASPIKLQVLDFARHAVTAPDDKRYVVATFDDTRLDRGYLTAIYPQQNGYLTLYCLTIHQHSSPTPEEALHYHVAAAQAIQQGHLDRFIKEK